MIVALEGIDGSGKTTLAGALQSALVGRGISAYLFQFSKDAGCLTACASELLDQGLAGRYYALHAMFAAARLAKLPYFLSPDHDVVLVDRYKYSTQIYGVCQGLAEAWCLGLEAPLPEAQLVLLLDLPVEAAVRRKHARDLLDHDVELQQRVRTRYMDRAHGRLDWHVLDARNPQEQIVRSALSLIVSGLNASRI